MLAPEESVPEGTQREVRRLLEDAGASLKSGHFIIASGAHSQHYMHVRLGLADRRAASRIAKIMLDEARVLFFNRFLIKIYSLNDKIEPKVNNLL